MEQLSVFFPKIPARNLTAIYIHRFLVAYAHVRPDVVVEVYFTPDLLQGFLIAPEHGQVIYPLVFEYAVHALGHGIVRGIVALRHANADMMLHEDADILLAGVLHAAVGVVNRAAEVAAPCCLHSHLQRLGCVFRLQCLGQAPAQHSVGVAVGHQVQVEHIVLYPYIGNVGIPDVVGIQGGEADCQVGILEVHVVGVRRMPRLLLRQHQLVTTQQIQERVASSNELTPKFLRQQHVQLHTAKARSLHAIPLHILDDYLYPLHLSVQHLALLVVPLPTLVKQSAKRLHTLLRKLLAERIYRLTPSFFNIEMPSSRSAISITFSKARQRMRSI